MKKNHEVYKKILNGLLLSAFLIFVFQRKTFAEVNLSIDLKDDVEVSQKISSVKNLIVENQNQAKTCKIYKRGTKRKNKKLYFFLCPGQRRIFQPNQQRQYF